MGRHGWLFTSDDVVFTFQFVQNKQTAANTYGSYVNVAKVEPLNDALGQGPPQALMLAGICRLWARRG